MFQFLAKTQVGCRRSFPRHLLHRITTLAFLLATAVIPQLLYTSPLQADQPTRPNIVLIMADDLGYAGLGCFGQEKIKTPQIDRIAKEGVKLTQCYAGSHVCQPSRSVLMTGLHTGHTPVRANDTRQYLLPEHVTVAEKLKSAGYRTGGFGKWGLGYEGTSGHPNKQGFDQFVGQYLQVHAHFYYPFWIWENETKMFLKENEQGQNQYVNDVIHQSAMDFLEKSKEGPFFAYLPYIIPHVELVVPTDSEELYRDQFPKIPIKDRRKNYLGSEDGLTTLAGMVTRLDDYVGEVLDFLDENDLADNTLIIFTSDNGAQSGGADAGWTKMTEYFKMNGPLRGYKGTFYEGGLRVPLVARWPERIPAGTESDHILGFWDVMPTLCEAVGIQPPDQIDGISFLPSMTGNGHQRKHSAIYWEYPRSGGISRAARMQDWKAIQAKPDGPVELYNLAVDLSESTNVAADHPEIVQRMVTFMNHAHVDQPPHPGLGVKSGVLDYVNGPWLEKD